MKQLQCNFTTIEQSKRLLELGVPAWTSDCFYEYSSGKLFDNWQYNLFVGESVAIKNNLFSFRNGYTIPCWSVGRLIEIFNECSNWNTVSMTSVTHETYIEQLIELYEKLIGSINFSKL